MKSIFLGHDSQNGQPFQIPVKALKTHVHLMGGTGKGKTTALHTMLHPLFLDPYEEPCFFIFDRLGNFSQELLLWMASDFCTEDVRNRLLYIEPAREDVVLGFNPLLYNTPAHAFYRVARATDIVLRAWESVNIEAMPRLARWTFNAFSAAAQLGLTIPDCVHFLMPGSPYHADLLKILPERLRYEWEELIQSRSGEVIRILESSRNRLKPYFESDILRRMFGSRENHLDVARFMREGKIVILNLAPGNRLSEQLSDAIGSLVLNEILATARSLPRGIRYPTYLVLDEFQNFVGPDMEAALPEVRQLGLRLLLSHQSFSQLKRGDYDLTSMIFQAQSRMIFGVQGEDADILAQELASITFDPNRIKDEIYSRRQLLTGHRVIELASSSHAEGQTQNWNQAFLDRWSLERRDSQGGGSTGTDTHSTHQAMLPEHEQFLELASRTYCTFEEQRNLWAQKVRNSPTGVAHVRLVDDPQLHTVNVKRSTPGYLGWDMETLVREFPEALDDMDHLVEQNFQSELFVAPEVIDREIHDRLQAIVHPKLTVNDGHCPRIPADHAGPILDVPSHSEKTENEDAPKQDPFC
jgi:hypothetical protein